MKPFDIVALGELNVDLILNQIDGFPEMGKEKFAKQMTLTLSKSFPGGSDGKVSAYNARDPCSIPGAGRSPGEGNGNPRQYSCLGNPC